MKKFNSGTIVMHTLVRLMVFRVRETIANFFSEKFESLYNSVSYDFNAMKELEECIESKITSKCSCNECDQLSHTIAESEVLSAIDRLKLSKNDVSGIMSDHIYTHAKSVYGSILRKCLFACPDSSM